MENRSAAGLRRSAIAERLRLREEWSALKGISEEPTKIKQKNVLTKRQPNISNKRILRETTVARSRHAEKENCQLIAGTSDVLRGVVVLVDVGSETRALALRAALSALGATVVPTWSPLVTHLVWSQGGCRDTRARARALACRVVSPLWVEACAGAARQLPEGVFPAPPRASDLPSPTTLRRMLKKAERENISLANLLSDSQNSDKPKRLRISSETEHDTTSTTNTSQDTSHDKSRDKSTDKSCETPGEEVRVNTAPRRALPMSTSPEKPPKSRRKLFTQREPDGTTDAETEEDVTPVPKKPQAIKMTQREKRDLARAERMARRLVTPNVHTVKQRQDKTLRIVLTGMSRTERKIVTKAIRHLNGHVQSKVDKRTDYVLLGSCSNQCPESLLSEMLTTKLNIDINKENLNEQGKHTKNMNVSGVCEFGPTKTVMGSHLTRVKETGGKNILLDENNALIRSNLARVKETVCKNKLLNQNNGLMGSNLTPINEITEPNSIHNTNKKTRHIQSGSETTHQKEIGLHNVQMGSESTHCTTIHNTHCHIQMGSESTHQKEIGLHNVQMGSESTHCTTIHNTHCHVQMGSESTHQKEIGLHNVQMGSESTHCTTIHNTHCHVQMGSESTHQKEIGLHNVQMGSESTHCTTIHNTHCHVQMGSESTQRNEIGLHNTHCRIQMGSEPTHANEIGQNLTPACVNEINDIGSVLSARSGVVCHSGVSPDKPRTVNTLLGAVRGCRVLYAKWVVDSIKENRWLHHIGYEVRHLMKISQKARVERSALGLMKNEYAYNVFRGMRVRLTSHTEQRDAVSQLLSMCGAVITQDGATCAQNGGLTQNGGQDGADITIGIKKGEICSKWVFDSITATRMRTTRRYIN